MGRGSGRAKVHITSICQEMPQGKDWEEFLCCPHNKTMLIRALVAHYKSEEVRKDLKYPVIVTEEEKTWGITTNSVMELLPCNHIEADTRLILEASKSELPVVIKATDTDVLVLMCFCTRGKQYSK